MIVIPEKKREHWDKSIKDILDAIMEEPMVYSDKNLTSIDENIVIIESTSIISEYVYNFDCDDNITGVSYVTDGRKYVAEGNTWEKIETCINEFYKLSHICSTVSKNSLREIILSWLFETKEKGKISVEFTQNIENELDKMVKEYIVYFPIPYINAKESYNLTKDISIGKLSDELIGSISPDLRKEQNLDGTFIHTKLFGEKNFVIEKAYERCSLAVDAIKSCYLTFYLGLPKVCLDIAKNVSFLPTNRCFVQESTQNNSLNITTNVNIHELELNKNFIYRIEEHHINDYAVFVNRIHTQKETELEAVLISAIRTYSKLLSNGNYYDRVVDLCSILDTLILTDDNVEIKRSLKKYVPIIIADVPVNRDEIRRTIDDMYKIRSQYIHHRKMDIIIKKSRLHQYQMLIFNLITDLVRIANKQKYVTMKDIMKTIDAKLDSVIITEELY